MPDPLHRGRGAGASGIPLALDAMGGDFAPQHAVQGAVEYARESGRPVLLVGQAEPVRAALRAARASDALIDVVPASEVIGFGEPIGSIRSRRDSSIHVGARLVRDGRAGAFVSAGHTGAVMAICKAVYGLLDGVDRPALPAPLPRLGGGRTVLIDAGANLDCRPDHLRQFAVMGFHYCRRALGVESPRVALLSVGEEDSKGSEVGREVARILRETPINFVGNVEGNHLFTSRADVVVCDGFVGNVALKVAEGIAESLRDVINVTVRRTFWRRVAGMMLKPAFRPLRKKIDYAEIGAAPLLGLRHIVMVGHGRSSAKAIKNALRAAEATIRARIVEVIAEEIALLHAAEQRLAARGLP